MASIARLVEQVYRFVTEGSYLTILLLTVFTLFLLYLLYDVAIAAPSESHPALPRPWRFPIVGNLPQFGQFPHETLTKFGKMFGDVFAVRLGSWDVLVINSLSAAKEALFQKSAHFSSRPPFFSLRLCDSQKYTVAFGDYGPSQIQRKKALLQAFHRVILTNPEHLNRMVSDEVSRMTQILSDTGGSPFDPRSCLKMVVSRLIYRLTFGGVVGPVEEHDLYQLFKLSRKFQEAASSLVLLADFMPWMKFAMRKQMNGMEDLVRGLESFVRQAYRRRKHQNLIETHDFCIARAIEKHVKSSVKRQTQRSAEEDSAKLLNDHKAETASGTNPSEPTEEGKGMDRNEMHKEDETKNGKKEKEFTQEEEDEIEMNVVHLMSADTFGAGTENTSAALSWAVAYIASHMELQLDLQAEIEQVIGKDSEPRAQHKQSMPLMQATILETLRLASVLPISLPHYCTKDSVVKGYRVAKGTLVLTNIWGINHDDRYFSHPDCFEPYRFLDMNGQLRADRCSLIIPFNTGPRTCAGNAVTKTLMFLLLSSLLQKFELHSSRNLLKLSPLPGPVLSPDFFEIVFQSRK